MQEDGGLAGARFDGALGHNSTRYKIGLPVHPALSADDPDTPGDETRTHLLVTGSSRTGVGMFSMGDLLGSGTASAAGERFVDSTVESIEEVRADVSALLALETRPDSLRSILGGQWAKVLGALDTVFGTDHDNTSSPTSAVRRDTPRNDDILDEIDDILDARATEDAFVAATEEDGDGVFDRQPLSASDASAAFNRVKWSAAATLATTGSTRYGTAVRQNTDDAVTKLGPDESGAFSYSTMQHTLLTRDVVSSTGIASYSGGTEAISGNGVTYCGTMDLTVQFSANSVSGVVSDLQDADGLRWQHNFADVDRIVLDDATLLRNATWKKENGTNATVFYTTDSGLLRPVSRIPNTFQGRLLGRVADAGSEANGVWSVNDANSSNYLTGGFGVTRGADATRPRPGGDDGSESNAMLIEDINLPTLTRSDSTSDSFGGTTIKDGVLQVELAKYGWVFNNQGTDDTADDTITYMQFIDDMGTSIHGPDGEAGNADDDATAIDDDKLILFTSKQELATLAGKGAGATTAVNGPAHVASVIAVLEAQRSQLEALRSLGIPSASTRTAEQAAWDKVVQAVQYDLFGGRLPVDLVGNYSSATDTRLREDALNLIDRMLDALSSKDKLLAALDPEGTGVFHHYQKREDASNGCTTSK